MNKVVVECKGRALVDEKGKPQGRVYTCEDHWCPMYETNWIPDPGLHPLMREFECQSRGNPHATYVVVRRRRRDPRYFEGYKTE